MLYCPRPFIELFLSPLLVEAACCVNVLLLLYPFAAARLPSPPRTPSYIVEQYGRDNVSLTVQWQSPQDDGGAPVSYTITVSSGSTENIDETNAVVTIPYNEMHNVSIVAMNCIGSSSAIVEAIQPVGMLTCYSESPPLALSSTSSHVCMHIKLY